MPHIEAKPRSISKKATRANAHIHREEVFIDWENSRYVPASRLHQADTQCEVWA